MQKYETGIQIEHLSTASCMKRANCDFASISEITDLSKKEIEKL